MRNLALAWPGLIIDENHDSHVFAILDEAGRTMGVLQVAGYYVSLARLRSKDASASRVFRLLSACLELLYRSWLAARMHTGAWVPTCNTFFHCSSPKHYL